jgi:hypothetical protein
MTPVDPTLLKRKELVKTARSLIRMKHAAACDEELALVLPQIEDAFDAAVLAGKAYELDVLALLDSRPVPEGRKRTPVKKSSMKKAPALRQQEAQAGLRGPG